MSDLASGNGAVLAAESARTPDGVGVNRMQHERFVENVAKGCTTLQTTETVASKPSSVSETPHVDDQRYAHEKSVCSPDGIEVHVSESMLRKVSARQLMVIQALLHGEDLMDAAVQAKVHRSTVFRWMKYDADFQAEYAAQRGALFEVAMSRAILAAGDAMDTVAHATEKGNVRAAIQLLKGLGILNGERPNFSS